MSADTFEVIGGNRLSGSLQPQGAKNEALQILCATLLTDQDVRIKNVPNILDIRRLISLLKGLGVKTEKHSDNDYTFNAANIDLDFFKSEDYQNEAKHIRGSVMLIAPLLARFGRAYLPKPGGDKIGRRRLDTHFNGLKKLGGKFHFDEEENTFSIQCDQLKGAYICLLYTSPSPRDRTRSRMPSSA